MAKFQLEMGGKNPLVVLDDANLEQAVEVALQGAFFSTGQRCTASSRLIVTAGIHDAFVKRLAERTQALVVGDARDAKTQIGPVVDANQLAQDERYIKIGKDEGAKLVVGGERVRAQRKGSTSRRRSSPRRRTRCASRAKKSSGRSRRGARQGL